MSEACFTHVFNYHAGVNPDPVFGRDWLSVTKATRLGGGWWFIYWYFLYFVVRSTSILASDEKVSKREHWFIESSTHLVSTSVWELLLLLISFVLSLGGRLNGQVYWCWGFAYG